MNLPHWAFLTAYCTGAAWLLAWEIIAVWVDKDRGDTITEFVRGGLVNPFSLPWWICGAFLLWLLLHFLGFGRFG